MKGQTVSAAPPRQPCSSAVLQKVNIMLKWRTDSTYKQESKTCHTHGVIPYISRLQYKKGEEMVELQSVGGGRVKTAADKGSFESCLQI